MAGPIGRGPTRPLGRRFPPSPAAEGVAARRGLAWSVGLAVLWLVFALRSAHVTYHLAPFLVLAAWPLELRSRMVRPAPSRAAAGAALGALSAALTASAVPAGAGALSGPSMWHGSGALETPIVGGLGAAWGWHVASRRRAGIIGRVSQLAMVDLLLPSTDGGVATQAVVALVVLVAAFIAVRRDRELRLFVAGVGVMTAAWFAVRTVH